MATRNEQAAQAARLAPICLTVAFVLNATRSVAADEYIADIVGEIGISPPLGAKVPLDLPLVDADGHSVRLGDLLQDRPAVLHLVYYECPMLCKLSSDGLLRALPRCHSSRARISRCSR